MIGQVFRNSVSLMALVETVINIIVPLPVCCKIIALALRVKSEITGTIYLKMNYKYAAAHFFTYFLKKEITLLITIHTDLRKLKVPDHPYGLT